MRFKLSQLSVVLLLLTVFTILVLASVSHATVTCTSVVDGTYTEIYNCTFSADTDTNLVQAHGLGVAPEFVSLAIMDANCTGVQNNTNGAVVQNSPNPFIDNLTTADFRINKEVATGSATCLVRVTLQRVHTIIR